MPASNPKPIRFAVVGLGHFAQSAILPAFANATDKAQLAALVTGDDDKADEVGFKYRTPSYMYEEYDQLLSTGEIDAVYIAVPNSKHRDFTERAAGGGACLVREASGLHG